MILPNFLSTNLNTEVEKNTQYQNNTDIYPGNRSLVILMGELRGGEPEALHKQGLDPNLADLALLTTNNSTHYPNSTLMKQAKYVWYYDNYDDWADALDLINGTGWRTTHLPKFPRDIPSSGG